MLFRDAALPTLIPSAPARACTIICAARTCRMCRKSFIRYTRRSHLWCVLANCRQQLPFERFDERMPTADQLLNDSESVAKMLRDFVQPLCRFCKTKLQHTFVDLGMSPLCESYLSSTHLNQMEPFYPLHVYVCSNCFLVQLEAYVSPEHIFSDYAYFSSYSDSWLAHAKSYTDQMTDRFFLDNSSLVVEVASNDGYLLQYFVQKSIPVLGIEPAANVAPEAVKKGVTTLVKFFGTETARELVAACKQADLLLGNNVLAQVPDLNDFVAGMKILLKSHGVITMEFPHLQRLMEENQFDTIYHEHFSYFSFLAVEKVFAAHGVTLFDVEEIPTHGGSLRIYGRHSENTTLPVSSRVEELRAREVRQGFAGLDHYDSF